jgi:hypothetical protein
MPIPSEHHYMYQAMEMDRPLQGRRTVQSLASSTLGYLRFGVFGIKTGIN